MKIVCIAIDDEPLALKQLVGYIAKTPFLELAAECESAFAAMEVMKHTVIQLLFIDINMPDLNGMEFVKSLSNKPYVVFTTAYSDYAVEGFLVDAVDYLLKPFSYGSFLKAANKVKHLDELVRTRRQETIRTTPDHLFVKSEYRLVRIELNDIRYIESKHEYVQIHLTNNKPVMTLMSMKSMEELLPAERFMRVHRSYIVNLENISVVERDRIVYDGKVYIPVSDQYKSRFHEYLEKDFLS
jgi:two-component system, LytTR family, response regulator LytT